MQARKLAVAVAFCAATWGCSQPATTTTTTVERKLTVTGSREGVERFVALQGSLRPRIRTSTIKTLADGKASATAIIPISHTGKDVIHTTREALAAGLSYKFKDHRFTSTKRS